MADIMSPDAPEMPATCAGVTPAKPRRRDGRSHGKAKLLTLDRLDRRTAAAQRAFALVKAIEADMGGGDCLSEGAKQLVQRAAVLGTFIESCEVKSLSGQPVELADYLAAVNNQRRVLATIGLERRARDVTPLDPLDYARRHAEAAE
jgi:hypothetical protein